MSEFSVGSLDHVELTVPDRYAAAAWFRRVLGLQIVPELEFWAEDPHGPLMIAPKTGKTKLALFAGPRRPLDDTGGFKLVAFSVDASGFHQFIASLDELGLQDHNGQQVTLAGVVDHDRAFSVYFCDPHGNRFEVTTYDYDAVRTMLREQNNG